MENACDERVLRTLDGAGRAAYSRALVACAVRQRPAAVCPLAFGETAVKERVKNAMSYRKPALWAAVLLLIAAVLKNLMKYAGVEAFLSGVRPCVVAMILATALNMMLSTLGGIKTLADGFAPDVRSILVFAVLWAVHFVWKKRTQKAPSPIGMILLAAGLGILFWGV